MHYFIFNASKEYQEVKIENNTWHIYSYIFESCVFPVLELSNYLLSNCDFYEMMQYYFVVVHNRKNECEFSMQWYWITRISVIV